MNNVLNTVINIHWNIKEEMVKIDPNESSATSQTDPVSLFFLFK